jgi:hypothetical protein
MTALSQLAAQLASEDFTSIPIMYVYLPLQLVLWLWLKS